MILFFSNIFVCRDEGRICSTVNGDLLWSQFGGGSLSIGIYVQLV